MFTPKGSFTVEGQQYFEWRCTSDGLIAVYNSALARWLYFRLNWRTTKYEQTGSTTEYDDPNVEAFDKSEVFPIR